jgi:hypothetical protein
MPAGLSFLFQAKVTSAQALHGALSDAPSPPADPDILHYLWMVDLPQISAPEGYMTFLLSTVYDEDFKDYIGDLVSKKPALFNAAAAGMLGFESVAGKMPDPAATAEFVSLVAARDLAQTNRTSNFVYFYPWTVAAIHQHMPTPGETLSGARPGSPGDDNAGEQCPSQ